MNKKTIAGAALSVILLTAGGWYINSQFNELNQRVDSITSDVEVDEIVSGMLSHRYEECASDAYEAYSGGWDRACWANGSDSDCRLVISDRYQVEQDYQNEVLSCLAEYK